MLRIFPGCGCRCDVMTLRGRNRPPEMGILVDVGAFWRDWEGGTVAFVLNQEGGTVAFVLNQEGGTVAFVPN